MPTSTISGAWSAYKNANHGPFLIGGNLYLLTSDSVQKSTNGGAAWSTVATVTGAETMTGAVSGTILHIAHVVGTTITYRRFDTTTDTLGASLGTATGANGLPGYVTIDIATRSNGDTAILYQSANSSVMGTSYRRVSIARYIGTTWTAATALTANDAIHYDAYTAVLGASDRIHLFYTGRTVAGATDLRHRVLLANNTLSTEQAVISSGNVENSAYPVGISASDGTTFAVPFRGAAGDLREFRGTSADTIGGTGNIVVTADSTNDPGALTTQGSTYHALWVTGGTAIKRASRTASAYGSATTVASGSATAILAQTEDTTGIASASTTYSQSFTPTAAWSVNGGTAKMSRNAGVTGSYVMEIATAAGTGGTVLASSGTMDIAALPTTAADISFSFGASVSLSSGVTYYLRRQIITSSGNISWRFSQNDPYSGGSRWSGTTETAGNDFVFSLTVSPFSTATHTYLALGSGGLYTLYDNAGTLTLDHPTFSGGGPESKNASAAIVGASTVTASATQRQRYDVSATITGTGTVTATATATTGASFNASAAITGTSTVTVAATQQQRLTASAAIAGTSTVTATATQRALQGVSATIAGTSTVTTAANVSAKVSASIAGTSTVTASAASSESMALNISAAIVGTSTVTASATQSARMDAAASITGAATVTATTRTNSRVSATIAGAATVTAIASASTPEGVTVNAAASITGTSAATASARMGASIAAATGGSATADAYASLVAVVGADILGTAEMAAWLTVTTAGGPGAPAARLAGIRWSVRPEPITATITPGNDPTMAVSAPPEPLAMTVTPGLEQVALAVSAGVDALAVGIIPGSEPVAVGITPGTDGLAMALTAHDLEDTP